MALNIIIISLLGLILSFYSFSVEKKKNFNKNYKPLCDIHKNISCTKAFSSRHGRILVFHNSTFGIIFYFALIILAIFNQVAIIFYLSIVAFLFSLYLAYVSYVKMKNFCLVCSAVYLINILIFLFSLNLIYIN